MLAVVCSAALGACGNTLQDQPISHSTLEKLLVIPYPVYWVGGSFRRLSITEAIQDPSGAVTIQYGDCLQGGQGTCVRPLRVVTSPDNSFVPGGSSTLRAARIRGLAAVVAQDGTTIEIPTSGVVVAISAASPRLASAAARTIVPLNAVGTPEAPLPARLPDTGFADRPLPSQTPSQAPSPTHALG